METVVLVMMILVCVSYILKQTFRKGYAVVLSALLCALFTGFMWRYAIEQSKSQISIWLSDSTLMLDVAVVLTIDVVLQISFCVMAAHILTSGKVTPRTIWVYRILRWFPGTLIFFVLFSLLVSVIFVMTGMSFSRLSWSLAIVVFLVLIGGTYSMKHLLPEKYIRLEMLFLSNTLIAILGVIATVNGRTVVTGISEVEWHALAGVCGLSVIGLVSGNVIYRIRLKHLIKK